MRGWRGEGSEFQVERLALAKALMRQVATPLQTDLLSESGGGRWCWGPWGTGWGKRGKIGLTFLSVLGAVLVHPTV